MLRTTLATLTSMLALPAATHAAIASCYGPGLYGNTMANGQTLTTRTIGVAHRTLPLGTRLHVRVNRITVTVVVKDRGPYTHGRTLDLTEATAQRLGYTSCNTFGVRQVRSWRA